jgi:hypothetical protein
MMNDDLRIHISKCRLQKENEEGKVDPETSSG